MNILQKKYANFSAYLVFSIEKYVKVYILQIYFLFGNIYSTFSADLETSVVLFSKFSFFFVEKYVKVDILQGI